MNHKISETSVLKMTYWDDVKIPYSFLKAVLEGAVSGQAQLYAYGEEKCSVLSELTKYV
jgi:hypothetical protein